MGANDREIGRRIAELRERRGWSQRALAKMVGLDQAVLSRVESGKREARAGELEALAGALGVEIGALLSPTIQASAPPVQSSAPPPAASRSGRRHEAKPYTTSRQESPVDPDVRKRMLRRREDVDAYLERMEPAPSERREPAPLSLSRDALIPPDAREASGAAFLSHDMRTDLEAPEGPVDWAFQNLPALPAPAETVIADYLRLSAVQARRPWTESGPWRSVDSLGRRRPAGKPAGRRAAAIDWHEPRDRYARLWRHELDIGGDGPVPDLVALFEDTGLAEVVVARGATDQPVAAAVTVPLQGPLWDLASSSAGDPTVSFLFVNALRPVTLQRFALAHAFAHLVLGHGDVTDAQIDWSRSNPIEAEANDFAEEFLAPTAAVVRWYDRHGDPRPSVDVLLDLGAAFGITFWAALYRSRAAGRLNPKLQSVLTAELRERQWELLPEQELRGGLRDTLSTLSEETPLPPAGAAGAGGVKPRLTRPRPDEPVSGQDAERAAREAERYEPAVLRVPSHLTQWTLQALRQGRLSFAEAARVLHVSTARLAGQLERLGIE